MNKKNFRSFIEARKFARSIGLKSETEWITYCKSGNNPSDIPASPLKAYRNKGWKGWGDWLGTERIANQNREYVEFTEARKFVHNLNLKSRQEWKKYCKSRKKPNDIPANPARPYKDEWKGWGDWLGTGTVAGLDRKYRSFIEARKFARDLGLKRVGDWQKYCRSGNKPSDIPVHPDRNYKNEWKSYGDWLGTGRTADQYKQYRPFNEAREYVRSLGLKGMKEWNDYCRSGGKPDDIPTNVYATYKNRGWLSLGDWLGTGTIATSKRNYRPFKEAREYVRSLKLKNYTEWEEYCKSGGKPDDIPNQPWHVYKEGKNPRK